MGCRNMVAQSQYLGLMQLMGSDRPCAHMPVGVILPCGGACRLRAHMPLVTCSPRDAQAVCPYVFVSDATMQWCLISGVLSMMQVLWAGQAQMTIGLRV